MATKAYYPIEEIGKGKPVKFILIFQQIANNLFAQLLLHNAPPSCCFFYSLDRRTLAKVSPLQFFLYFIIISVRAISPMIEKSPATKDFSFPAGD